MDSLKSHNLLAAESYKKCLEEYEGDPENDDDGTYNCFSRDVLRLLQEYVAEEDGPQWICPGDGLDIGDV